MAGPIFSFIRNQNPTFPGDFTIFTDASTQRWGRPYEGFPNLRYLDPFGPPAPYQFIRAQGGDCCPRPLGLSAPGPPGFDRYGQYDSSFLYQKTRRNPFANLVAFSSGSLYVAASSGHSSQSQAPSRLFERDSGQPIQTHHPISTEWSLYSEILNQIFQFWGTPALDMFATVHNTRLLQFMSQIQEPLALLLAVDASSRAWQGRLMYMFLPIPLLDKVNQKHVPSRKQK